jgi:hypothetical protein
MAKQARYNKAARRAAIDAITALLNGGKLQIRSLAAPADPDAAETGTLLAELTPLPTPAFGAADAVTLIATANAVPSDNSADATGTAAHYTALDSGGNKVCTGTVGGTAQGDTGATVNLLLNTTAIVAGAQVSITSWTIGPLPLESTL